MSYPGRFNPAEEFRYPLSVSLIRHPHPSGSFGEEKNLLALKGFQPRTDQPAAVTLYHRSSILYCTVLC